MFKRTMPAMLGTAVCVLLLLLGLGGQGCNAATYKKISVTEAKSIMDSGDPYVLLDVREEDEFKERHIGGAVLLPYTEIQKRAASELPDKDALILVYCRSGRRSAIAANDLIRMGYTRVYDFGGINDWPHAVVSGASGDK